MNVCYLQTLELSLSIETKEQNQKTTKNLTVMETRILNAETKIYNSLNNGWTGKTVNTIKGVTFEITTLKRYNNKISAVAQQCEVHKGAHFVSTSFALFSDKSYTLISEEGKATEAKIREIHCKALLRFDELVENGTIAIKPKAKDLEVGQLFFMSGYGTEDEKLAIYKIEGRHYYFVNTKTLTFGHAERIRPYSEKFGIGYYYHDNDIKVLSDNDLTDFILKANEKKLRDEDQRQREAAERAAKIEAGLNKLSIPEDAKAVIVAQFHINDSDVYTDYFASQVQRVVYLAFSNNTREILKEMRKAAALWEETKYLDSEEFERRENYSMGRGNYLASHSYSGWQIKKCVINKGLLNEMALAIEEGDFLIGSFDTAKAKKEDSKLIEKEDIQEVEELEHKENKNDIVLLDYSERSFAVFGNTRAIKEELKALGGRFNNRLTHPESKEVCPGWIFPLTFKSKVVKGLGL